MRILVGVLFLSSLSACYTYAAPQLPYNNGLPVTRQVADFNAENPQFESGEPYWILDAPGHYFFSLLSKLILWNWKMNNHDISEETKLYLQDYIRANRLQNVKVRFNMYDPADEWHRLTNNPDVHWLARYTVGVLNWVIYTILPERLFAGLFGGDHYNPYTNSINIYTDLPAVVLHEGGHAKDISMRLDKTGYALVYALPLAPLYHEARASEDAFHYIAERKKEQQLQREAYEQLAPAYATYIGGQLFDSYGFIMVIPGHAYGRYKSWRLSESDKAD
ncbi:MAG: hypothetical protein KDK39_18570 [Leptospiraceae bacterium]|nr:hypothetical protein [Leptospiraceae bacterium]